MNKILSCRRTFIAFAALAALLTLGLINDIDTSMAIASTAAALSAANSWEKRAKDGR